MPLREYAQRWLATRDLKPSTLDGYEWLLRRWILTPLPSPGGARQLDLGSLPLRSLSHTMVSEWYAALLVATAESAAEWLARGGGPSDAAHVRACARSTGLPVGDSGRMPARLWEALRAAGSPASGACRFGLCPSPPKSTLCRGHSRPFWIQTVKSAHGRGLASETRSTGSSFLPTGNEDYGSLAGMVPAPSRTDIWSVSGVARWRRWRRQKGRRSRARRQTSTRRRRALREQRPARCCSCAGRQSDPRTGVGSRSGRRGEPRSRSWPRFVERPSAWRAGQYW